MDKDLLEKVQRRAIKMVSGLKTQIGYEDGLLGLGMLTLGPGASSTTVKVMHRFDNAESSTWFTIFGLDAWHIIHQVNK